MLTYVPAVISVLLAFNLFVMLVLGAMRRSRDE
jgi:hypothetical protein